MWGSKVKRIIKELLPIKVKYLYHLIRIKKRERGKDFLLKENVAFKNKHKGQRCFIIGNGPSINNVDFSKLRDEVTFTVNQMSRREDFEELKTNYHMWADERFFDIDESKPEDMELLEAMRAVKSGSNSPVVFYKIAAHDMIKKFKLDETLDIHYFSEIGFNNINRRYKVDFCKRTPSFSTVVHYLILLAIYMGFKEIYLLGCDCTGIINTVQSRIKSKAQMEYAYNISENERKRMEKSNSMFPIQDELRWYANIFDCYEQLNNYCNANNVKLYNATEGSLLESIEKVQLEDILNKK